MLGGTPRCERCGKAVYHAEQVMGPGRKIYHKLCLKCDSCGKRLDQGSLVQHDLRPYCARCHTQVFGTKDLRHANLHTPSTSVNRIPSPPSPPEDLPPRTPRPVAPPQEYYTPPPGLDDSPPAGGASVGGAAAAVRAMGGVEAGSGGTSLDDVLRPGSRAVGAGLTTPSFSLAKPSYQSSTQASAGPAATSTSAGGRTTISIPLYAPAAEPEAQVKRVDFRAERPIPSGLTSAAAAGQRDSPRSKVGPRPDFEDRCHGCEKRVYAAEQVFAIGKKWHRWCLRCTSCNSTIDPSKVSDRDGQPWCNNCYAREHGPGGIAGKR